MFPMANYRNWELATWVKVSGPHGREKSGASPHSRTFLDTPSTFLGTLHLMKPPTLK